LGNKETFCERIDSINSVYGDNQWKVLINSTHCAWYKM